MSLGKEFGATDIVSEREAYKAVETLLANGKVRAIGVSNFMPNHLDVACR